LPKKTFEVAAEANTALIVQVKDNQPTLNQKIQEIATTTAPIDAVGSRTRGRNRDERRTVTVFDPAEKFTSTEWHPHVAAIVCVERKVFTRIVSSGLWDRSTETTFYVSNTIEFIPICNLTRLRHTDPQTGGMTDGWSTVR
jgi:hypothetical protein